MAPLTTQNTQSSQNTQLNNDDDDPNSPNHPLYLHQNDHPGLILISKKLTGSENYGSWKRSMMIALNAKNKLKIVISEYNEPEANSRNRALWEITNDMIISWILNIIAEKIPDVLRNWKSLIDKFKAKLSSWKANLLSFGGRLTLIKSVLGSLGIYYFSIFKVSVSVLKSLEKMRATFFWGGTQDNRKLAWLKWPNVVASFEKGGLNIGSLKSFNLALLYKWRWRMYSSPNSLRVKVIKSLHGIEGGFDNIGCNHSGLWDKIVGSVNYLHSSNILPMDSILHLVLDNDGIFTVGALRRLIDNHLLPSLGSTTTWDKNLPQKVNIFLWRLKLDKLHHRLNLSLRGIELPEISCPSCNALVESNQHVFFTCGIAKEI
ncbi:RNA-directed DNA polymerase, eukaryota, reverse transcriptase zinc-binding domain protein [Tanacetum coccineum]